MNPAPSDVAPQDVEDRLWDVIVVGAGAGGATAGFNLARAGFSVLFVERGKLLHRDPTVVKGAPWTGQSETALDHGWWPRSLYRRDEEDAAPAATRPPIGCGAGGSTALFGAVMDRFRPEDFTPRRFYSDVADTSLPEAWPVGYEDLAPYYDQAESLYRIRGTQDPLGPKTADLREPPPASERELSVIAALKGAGLNPYRFHYAMEQVPGCRGCAGTVCPRSCRNDAARMCLYPALDRHGAEILTNCRAIRLEESGRVVEKLVCEWNQRRIALRARVFILAANAFMTPALLQRSANDRFPSGLANSSGLVGRNLMLHATNHLFVRLKQPAQYSSGGMNYGLSLNDFYVRDGVKLGNFHAHPIITREQLMTFMVLHSRGLNRLPGRLIYMIASMGTFLSRPWTAFSGIIEDLPYPGNHVAAKPGSEEDIVYTYRYPDELRRRALMMCNGFKDAIASMFDVRPFHPVGAIDGIHACGTCRFGDDARTSVLDRDNRAHDLDNLYVLDASFFPSSGGINPSLTIVANSLRASDKIARRL